MSGVEAMLLCIFVELIRIHRSLRSSLESYLLFSTDRCQLEFISSLHACEDGRMGSVPGCKP